MAARALHHRPPPDLARASAASRESATLAVDAKAKALKAAGRPVIGFGAGEPDFATPDYIVEAAVAACPRPHATTATPRPAACPSSRRRSPPRRRATPATTSTPAQVLVTNGGKQAVYEAFATLLDPGDEVLLPAPYWTTYPEAIRLAGGVPVDVLADETQGYLVTVEQLEAARTDRTKALLFCSPSNPTGAVYPREQVRAIGQWALEHGIWVVTDEIYEHLVYGGAEFSSIVGRGPRARRHVRRAQRGGQDVRHDRLAGRLDDRPAPTSSRRPTNLQSHATSNVANVSQRAAHRGGVRRPERGRDDARGVRPAAPDDRVAMLNDVDGFVCPEPQGAFYAYPSVKGALGRDIGGRVAAVVGRARRDHPRRGRGRGRARARRSGRPATCGCRTRSATTTSPRASSRIQTLLGLRPSTAVSERGRHPTSGRPLAELPKAHLHLHFTGSMRHATVLELAERDRACGCPTR